MHDTTVSFFKGIILSYTFYYIKGYFRVARETFFLDVY